MSSTLERLATPDYKKDGHIKFLPNEFEDQIILIVGGSRGIGAAVAKEVAVLGPREVIINSREQSRKEATDVVKEVELLGIESHTTSRFIHGDITVPDEPERIVSEAAMFGKLGSVIISAGIKIDKPLIGMSRNQIWKVYETNLVGPTLVAFEVLKQMRKQKPRGGSIVFLSSLAAEGNSGQAIYAASKGGVNSLVKSLALEYFNSGIRVNAIAPGLADTDLTADLSQKQREGLLQVTGADRALTPQEVAEHVLFYASPLRESSVTGLIVPLIGKGAL